jgi:RNA polymerase sigma factor (sigma-70 family)
MGVLDRASRCSRSQAHCASQASSFRIARRDVDTDVVCDETDNGPHESAAKSEAVRMLHAILDELEDDKREVFILSELEQMTVPEIAEAVGINVNTAYARLRSARTSFDEALERQRARERWLSRSRSSGLPASIAPVVSIQERRSSR